MAAEFLTVARQPTSGVRRTGNPQPLVVQGTSGAIIHGGFLADNEKNPALAGRRRYVTFSDMLANVSIIAAGSRYYLNLLAKASWNLEPADDTDEAKRLADDVSAMLEDMRRPWSRVIRSAGMYRFYGFSVQEWTAKRREDGTFGLLDVAVRPQSSITKWDTEADGHVVGCIQQDPNTFAEYYLPRAKTMYVVDDALRDTPEGMGILRQLAEPAEILRELQLLERYGYEMDLHGVPIIRAPLAEIQNNAEMSEAEKTAATAGLITFLQNHARRPDTGLMLDSAVYTGTGEQQTPTANRQWDIETLTSGSADSAVAVGTAIERLNREMARIMGVEELMLGSDSAGSFAMSKQKSDNFALMVDSSLQEIRFAAQQDIVGSIFRINGWDTALMPKFRTEQIAFRDIEAIGQVMKDLSAAGAMLTPNDPAINEIRRLVGLSPQDPIDLEELLSLMVDPAGDENENENNGGSSDGDE